MSPWKSLVWSLVVLGVPASLVVPTETSASRVVPTTIVLFPWQSDGRLAPQVHVTRRVAGVCFYASFFLEDQYAWRCEAASGNLLDPCFSPMEAHAAEVVCTVSPWLTSGITLVKLQKPLPLAKAAKAGDWTGWALQLRNKARCIIVAGTHSPPVSGGPAPYDCASGYYAADLDTSSERWVVSYWGDAADLGGPASADASHEETVVIAFNGPD